MMDFFLWREVITRRDNTLIIIYDKLEAIFSDEKNNDFWREVVILFEKDFLLLMHHKDVRL